MTDYPDHPGTATGEVHGRYYWDGENWVIIIGGGKPPIEPPPDVSITRDIVADYGADPTGTRDGATAFNDFHTEFDGHTDPVVLDVPAGSYLFNTNSAQFFTRGITDLTVRGDGVDATSWTRVMPSANPWKLGADGLKQDGLHSAKVATVEAGSDEVTLLDETMNDRFIAGQRCILAGVDLQGMGDPFNNHLFEFLTIANIDGQTVTLTAPLQNGYRDTWPHYNDGTMPGCGMDQGGAATLYALVDYADCVFTLMDLTLIAGAGVGDPVGYICGRNVKLENVKLDWHYGFSPTVAEICTIKNCDLRGQLEVDKSVGELIIQGGSIEKIWFQSSSTGLLKITDGALVDYLAQTPRRIVIDGATVNRLQMGPGYGVTESVTVNNSVVKAFEIGSPTWPLSGYSCEDGIIKHLIPEPLHLKPLPWAIPGGVIRFTGANGWLANAEVIDIWRDETHNYVQTSLEDGFPAGATSLGAHPCANWSGTDNTGCPEIIEHSMPQAQGKPIYSYSHRSYDHTLPVKGCAKATLWGEIVSIKVNVVEPYTGSAQNVLKFHLSAFDNWPVIRADGATIYSMPLVVDARIAGERVFTPVGSNTGIQGGDIAPKLLLGDRMGRQSHSEPIYTSASGPAVDVSGENAGPVITVEIVCDQGVG